MTKGITLIVCLISMVLIALTAYGQSGFTLSIPVIYSKIEVANNWSPPTAVNRQNQFDGTSLGYGVNVNYSFRPTFIIKSKYILLNIGVGYFQQRFDIRRPFNYNSFIYIIYYTDYYVYHSLNLSVGLTYHFPLGKNYFLTGNLFYYRLNSFRQDYTPTYSSYNRGFEGFTQIAHNQIDFGDMLNLAIGINKNLGNKFSLGLSALVPVYIRWRNDKIFGDDPFTFYRPKFSLGSSISITYRLKSKH